MRTVSIFGAKAAVSLVLLFQVDYSLADMWQDIDQSVNAQTAPSYARILVADHAALQQVLAAAPMEFTSSQGVELRLPMPDGSMQRFEVENSPIMAPELAARYPQIQTYRARGIDDPVTTGRLDMTPAGFHGMISTSEGAIFINPDGAGGYHSYYEQDYLLASKGVTAAGATLACLVDESMQTAARPIDDYALRTSGTRHVYTLAVAATGEYTEFHGGTVSSALAAIVTAISRVNLTYAQNLAIQFQLAEGNDSIIYTNSLTDPYTNDDGTAMLDQNQANLDAVIGSANYDIGHVFSTGGGGIAVVGSTCRPDSKAKGVTGRPNPVGDPFYIDLVAHELGHQLSAAHTFNGTTDGCAGINRIADSAVEPGSGSTIMSYTGLCGAENLQSNADDMFHAKSMQQIVSYTTSGTGSTCGTTESTGNTAPTVLAGDDYTIPLCTPFALTAASVADVDQNDVLTHQWDEMDVGAETNAVTFGTDLGNNALFRSYLPKDDSERIFPRMSALANGTSYKGETLPAAARTMNFRLTVRDGLGGVNEDDVQVSVDGSQGPFRITGGTLNSSESFQPGTRQTIEWSVGNTQTSCPQVNISLLAFDSAGSEYCDTAGEALLDLGNYDNSGIASVLLPDLDLSKGRVKVACANNIYFSLSAADIELLGDTMVSSVCKSTNHDPLLDDGFGDRVEACRIQIGEVITPEPVPEPGPDDDGGGGGSLFWLSLILGLTMVCRELIRVRREVA